jgi:hypothetical protein
MKQYKVLLTKIKSNHSNLRTDTVEGVVLDLPEKGKSIVLVGKPLIVGMDARVVATTEIQNVEKLGEEYQFVTLNSTYKLKVLEEINE